MCFVCTFLWCRVPLDAQVLSQALGERPCHGQAVAVLHETTTQQTTKTKNTLFTRKSQRLRDMQTKLRWTTSDLIHPYAPAHRTHASEVRSAASTVVEGHISWRLMNDRSGRDRQKGWWKHHRGLDKGKQELDQTLDFLFCSNCRYARWQSRLVSRRASCISGQKDINLQGYEGKKKPLGRN